MSQSDELALITKYENWKRDPSFYPFLSEKEKTDLMGILYAKYQQYCFIRKNGFSSDCQRCLRPCSNSAKDLILIDLEFGR